MSMLMLTLGLQLIWILKVNSFKHELAKIIQGCIMVVMHFDIVITEYFFLKFPDNENNFIYYKQLYYKNYKYQEMLAVEDIKE